MLNDWALLDRRTSAGPGREREHAEGHTVIQFFAQFAFLAVFLVPSLDHRFVWSNVPIYAEIAGRPLTAQEMGPHNWSNRKVKIWSFFSKHGFHTFERGED
jgi:hypothetical protein